MLTELLAMVGGDNHDGIVEGSAPTELAPEPPQFTVQVKHFGVVQISAVWRRGETRTKVCGRAVVLVCVEEIHEGEVGTRGPVDVPCQQIIDQRLGYPLFATRLWHHSELRMA